MPASSGASGDDSEIDEFWFHSPLEDEPAETMLAEQTLTAYPIIMAIPNDVELHVTVYAAPHALASDMALIRPGEDLQGFLWLQGHLAESQE